MVFRIFLLSVLLCPLFVSAQINETPFATAEVEVNLPIPDDGTTLQSFIDIPSSGLIEDIQIALRVQHPTVEDLRISITSPTGLITVLHDQTPSSQSPFNPVYETVTESVGSLTVFTEINAQGRWTLSIEDNIRGNVGILEAWGISLSPARLLDPLPPTPAPILPGTDFETASTFIPNASASGIQCTDVNQDGLDDVLVFSKIDQSVLVYISNGTELNLSQTLFVSNPKVARVSDLNRDGNYDLVVGSEAVAGQSSVITIFISTPDGEYSKGFTAEIQTELRTLSVIDVNNDMIPDIAIGGHPFILLGVGDGSFQPPQTLVFLGRDFFASADINNDGFKDLFVSISRGGTSTNNDPHVILLDNENPSQFQSRNGKQVELDGIFLQSSVASTREPGIDEYVVLSQTEEAEPVQLLTTIRNSINGEIITEQSRLAPNTILTPFTTFDMNGDGLDEFIFVSPDGVTSFQKNPAILGGDTQTISMDTTIQHVCAGLFFENSTVGLAAVTSNNEVLLLKSNLGERPTPPQFITPTPTPTSALFITPTPAPPTPTPQNTPTPTPGLFGNPDLNGDGIVNKLDLLLLIQRWNTSP